MEGILLVDVHSVLKYRELYGRAGDQVTVTSARGNVLIVRGPKWVEVEEGKKTKLSKAGFHLYPVETEKVKTNEAL